MEQVYTPKQNYKVLVNCMTYNQSMYIEDALNGFAMQKTDFPFVCLVMDDASTDGEQEVIKAWMERECDMGKAENVEIEKSFVTIVPHKSNSNCTFAFYFLKENLYRSVAKKMCMLTPWHEHCEYEAFCEGDDYWISVEKLQMQVGILDNHPDYSMCFHNSYIREELNASYSGKHRIYNKSRVADTLHIFRDGGFIPTASILIRTNMYLNFEEFPSNCPVGDLRLQIYAAINGDVYYVNELMAVYRRVNTSATHVFASTKEIYTQHHQEFITWYKDVDVYTKGEYHEIIDKSIAFSEARIYIANQNYKPLWSSRYRDYLNDLSYNQRIGLYFNMMGLHFIYRIGHSMMNFTRELKHISLSTIKYDIANLLPRPLTLWIKYIYQWAYRLIKCQPIVHSKYNIGFVGDKSSHVFFGYYDVSPFNEKTDEFLYNKLTNNKLNIYLSNADGGKDVQIASSTAWNWQQGCRLRWMPGNNREIIFNDYDGNNYLSKIVNVDTKRIKTVCAPLYDISCDGTLGVSVDFERLGVKRPGYGYTCRPYIESEHNLSAEGIDLVDIASNTKKMILTYADIQKIKGCNTGDLKNNYINHLCFSPSGRQFLFFWLTVKDGLHKAFLLVHNLDNNQTKLLERFDIVSHYAWYDDDNIICTAIDSNNTGRYYNYKIPTGEKIILNPEILNTDGHPSVYNQHTILSDTYPDMNGFQRLFFADTQNGGYIELLRLYSNCRIEGERRTDLHPRFNRDKSVICFDCNPGRYRQMGFLKL